MKTPRKMFWSTLVIFLVTLTYLPVTFGQTLPPRSGVVEFDPSKMVPPSAPSSGAQNPDPLAPSVGTNVKVNQDAGSAPQNETSMAANPTNPSNLVGSANDYATSNGDSGCGFYSSSNGGSTWVSGTPLRGPGYLSAGDPSVGFDTVGNAYLTCLSFLRTTSANELRVFKSSDGGKTWPSSGLIVAGANNSDYNDKPYMAIDTTTSVFKNNIYVSWTYFGPTTTSIRFSRSTNGGASFSAPVTINDSVSSVQFSQPAVGPNGEVYIVWRDYNLNGIRIDKSLDGGVTWNAVGSDHQVALITPQDSINLLNRASSYPSIAVDTSGASSRGNVYVVWHGGSNGSADILSVRSTDGGSTWSGPIRVNDNPIADGTDQFFPWINVQSGGKVNVMWLDRRLDSTNHFYQVYFAQSLDGGVTFGSNIKVSTAASDPCVSFGCPNGFIGDYSGMASVVNNAYPFWVDTRNGNQDVFTAPVTTEGAPIFNDNFNRTTGLGTGWRIYYPGFSTDGSYAVSSGTAGVGKWAGVTQAWTATDYAVESAITPTAGTHYSGVVVRGRTSDLSVEAYAAQLDTSGSVNLWRRSPNGIWTLLKSAPAVITAGTSYKLKLLATGSFPVNLSVHFQGSLIPLFTFSDTASNRITLGIPGIETYDPNAKWDYFTVTGQ